MSTPTVPRTTGTESSLAPFFLLAYAGAWLVWVLPLAPGDQPLLGQTVVLTWVYQSTGGSVLLVSVLHAAANTGMGVLPVLPLDAGGSERVLWLVLAMEWLVVGALVRHCGRDLGAPRTTRQAGSTTGVKGFRPR